MNGLDRKLVVDECGENLVPRSFSVPMRAVPMRALPQAQKMLAHELSQLGMLVAILQPEKGRGLSSSIKLATSFCHFYDYALRKRLAKSSVFSSGLVLYGVLECDA